MRAHRRQHAFAGTCCITLAFELHEQRKQKRARKPGARRKTKTHQAPVSTGKGQE